MAPSSLHCFKTGLEGFSWFLAKQSQFDAFGDIFAAWLQNLLGNVITFNSLYKKIEEATEAENTKEIYFWYGRFTILFIDFEPLVEEDIDTLDDEFGFDDDFISTDVPMNLLAAGGAGAATQQPRNLKQSSFGRRVSPKVSGIFGNSFALANGFVNASFGDASPNAKICETNITRMISFGIQFSEQVRNSSEEQLAAAAVSAENVLEAIHPITFSCYTSIFEFGATGDYYMDTFSDFNKVTYNMIHKLGNIYDTIYYLTKHQNNYDQLGDMTEAEVANWWFKLGIYYGTTVFLVFYTPDEIDPYDPLDEYTGLENGDHLDDGTETNVTV